VSDHTHRKIRGKLDDRENVCIFVGYSKNHAKDCYKFMNVDTKGMIFSRDVIWLNKMYGDYIGADKVKVLPTTNPYLMNEDSDSDNDYEEAVQSVDELEYDEDSKDNDIFDDRDNGPMGVIPNSRLTGELRRLTTSYNSNPGAHLETAMLTNAFCFNIPGFDDGSNVPKSYKDAVKSQKWLNWKEAIFTEFKNMETKGVWELCKLKDVPPGRKIIGNLWVMAEKDDGRLRARTVTQGFSQVPGQDFQESHAPVVNDSTFRMTLVFKIIYKLMTGQFDVEIAFLYSDLKESIWMRLTEGYVEFLKDAYGKTIDPSL
jgi:Reverse transcriptase (RNA-dependent DNA polymerase)